MEIVLISVLVEDTNHDYGIIYLSRSFSWGEKRDLKKTQTIPTKKKDSDIVRANQSCWDDIPESMYCADDNEYRRYCDICDELPIDIKYNNHLKSQTHEKILRKSIS